MYWIAETSAESCRANRCGRNTVIRCGQRILPSADNTLTEIRPFNLLANR